jgi:hypothetical protein
MHSSACWHTVDGKIAAHTYKSDGKTTECKAYSALNSSSALNIVNYVESAMEGTNVLQEEDDKSITLVMHMHPKK